MQSADIRGKKVVVGNCTKVVI